MPALSDTDGQDVSCFKRKNKARSVQFEELHETILFDADDLEKAVRDMTAANDGEKVGLSKNSGSHVRPLIPGNA